MSEATAQSRPATPNTTPLAIHGGEKVRKTSMPPRISLGPAERAMINEVLDYYGERQIDPGYQGHFEKLYTDAFVEMMGGGYADGVATGTSALYVAVAALDLPKGSEVLVSPITDPGSLSAIVLNGLKPRLMDSMPDSYNVGPEQFAARIGPNVSAAMIVHSVGYAAPIEEIVTIARQRGVKVIEDCAQSHMAKYKSKPVGTFGDVAAFSTMYRKAHSSGPSGGIVYSRDLDLFRKMLIHADRGKPRWRDDFDDRDPSTYMVPALNHHTDEISCAVGYASLRRLGETMVNRLAFASDLVARLYDMSDVCRGYPFMPTASLYFFPIIVDVDAITCSKTDFALAVRAEGIDLNPHYKYLVREWPYIQPYLADDFDPPNARSIRDRSFNLYLNEKYTEQESRDIAKAIVKVEKFYKKKK
jgi:dTDP-4-amino-4,6-dideoxygalactose transaminase